MLAVRMAPGVFLTRRGWCFRYQLGRSAYQDSVTRWNKNDETTARDAIAALRFCFGIDVRRCLDAMSDPFWPGCPKDQLNTIGPRNIVRSWATNVDNATVQPRWGKVGKHRIMDEGPLSPTPTDGIKYNMETVVSAFLAADRFHRPGQQRKEAVFLLAEPEEGNQPAFDVATVFTPNPALAVVDWVPCLQELFD